MSVTRTSYCSIDRQIDLPCSTCGSTRNGNWLIRMDWPAFSNAAQIEQHRPAPLCPAPQMKYPLASQHGPHSPTAPVDWPSPATCHQQRPAKTSTDQDSHLPAKCGGESSPNQNPPESEPRFFSPTSVLLMKRSCCVSSCLPEKQTETSALRRMLSRTVFFVARAFQPVHCPCALRPPNTTKHSGKDYFADGWSYAKT